MDPLSVIGGISATGAIVAGVVKTLQSLSDAKGKFDNADTTIQLLCSELVAVKAAVVQIEDWARYSFSDGPKQRDMVDAFQLIFDGVKLSMDLLAKDVASLMTGSGSNNPFMVKAKYTWNEVEMKDHAERMRSQISALQLLVNAVNCQNAKQQTDLLRAPTNRRIIKQIEDDTSTLRVSRRGSRAGSVSIPPTIISHAESTIGEEALPVDRELVNTNPYRRAMAHQTSKRRQAQEEQEYAHDVKTQDFYQPIPSTISRSVSDVTISKVSHRPPPTIVTDFTHETHDSGYGEGIIDEDAFIVNPSAYREAMGQSKQGKNVHRSVSDPRSITSHTKSPHYEEARDQLSPMERFQSEPQWQRPQTYTLDPLQTNLPIRPAHHHSSASDPSIPRTVTTSEIKKSPWGTLKRLTSRAVLSPATPTGSSSPSMTTLPKLNQRTVKRKSETNIHESIDFGSEDGLGAPIIVRAAQSGSRMEIERLLEQRTNVEAVHGKSGRTALAVASHCGNDGVVALLLHHRAQVDVKDALGMTPLHLAASRGHYRVVRYLLDDHANADALGPQNKTPLRFASDNGHFECCELLIQYRAKVNARDNMMFTALHAAARIGDAQIVDLLIKNGADFEAKDAQLMTAMHYASERDYDHVVEALLAHKADIESSGAQGKTPLCCACATGSHATATLLLQRKANYKHKAEGDMTPLHWSCFHDRPETADLLLQQKRIVIDAKNAAGRTPLHLAIMGRSFAAAELLIRKGADVESPCKAGVRPIHYACDAADQIITSLLLGNGAAIDAPTPNGLRPIHLAAMKGSEPVIDMLLRRGSFIDGRAESPSSSGSSGERPLCLAASAGHLGTVKFLLDRGAAMHTRAPRGPSLQDSPLCRAAKGGHADVVRELIARGASVGQRDEQNWQPLRYAAYHGSPAVVALLLEHKAPIMTFDVGHNVDAMMTAASIGFAPDVSQATRYEVLQLLGAAEARERTRPRRVSEHDPFLTVVPNSVLEAGRTEGQPLRVYEAG